MRFRVFVFLLFFAAFSVFSQNADDNWYHGKPIRDIVFSGLRSISQSELDGLMNPFKGRIFDDTVFWEITGRLYALEYFDHIEPSTIRANPAGSEVVIRFTVIERPVISRINFVGNSGLRRTELSDLVTSKAKDIYNNAKVRIDIEAITNKYIEKGYPNISVTASDVSSGENSVILNFNITEGDRVSISKIEFVGNTRFTSNTLRGQLSLKAKSLLNDGAFQEAKLLTDREAITSYYHDRGLIDALVRDVTRSYDADDKGTNLILTFMIEEGSEFRFGGIAFEGNVIFTSEQLQKLVTSKEGDVVNMTRLEMDMQRIADLYFENGYIFNSITRTPDKNYRSLVLSYKVSIIERSRAYIENIIITGNNKTKSHVILREIPLEPGDVFSKTKVMDAMRNLYNLQYFSMIVPDTLQGSAENLMDLVFNLEEQPTTDIQFGLTFSGSADPDAFPISFLVKWNDKNIAGSGNELGAEVNSSVIDTSSFAVNYLHRWVLGMPLSLGFDLSANYTNRLATMDNQPPFFFGDEANAFPDGFSSYQEYFSRKKIPARDYLMDYEQWYISLGISSGYRWSTLLGIFGIGGGFRFGILRNSYDSEMFRPFDPTIRNSNNMWTPKNSIWMTLSLDQRDIFYDPSRGYYVYERFGIYGILQNDVEREYYLRSDSKLQYYLTLFNLPVTENWNFKSVLALHGGLSFIFNQPGKEGNIPVMEDANKLAVDGMFTGRGWSGEYRNKGLLLVDSWAELRFPLVRGILAFDFFFDAAAIETQQGYYFGHYEDIVDGKPVIKSNFTWENFRFSFGGGFRFTMPQFPLRLSLAKRFLIVDGAVEWQRGILFSGTDPESTRGLDLVLSFVLSY